MVMEIFPPDHDHAPVYCSGCGLRALDAGRWNTRPTDDVDAAKEALEPFALACTISNRDDDENIEDSIASSKITYGHLRKACATLERLGRSKIAIDCDTPEVY